MLVEMAPSLALHSRRQMTFLAVALQLISLLLISAAAADFDSSVATNTFQKSGAETKVPVATQLQTRTNNSDDESHQAEHSSPPSPIIDHFAYLNHRDRRLEIEKLKLRPGASELDRKRQQKTSAPSESSAEHDELIKLSFNHSRASSLAAVAAAAADDDRLVPVRRSSAGGDHATDTNETHPTTKLKKLPQEQSPSRVVKFERIKRQSQHHHGSLLAGGPAPKLIQWSKEAVQYYEGSTLVLSCSLAISPTGGLKFSWFKGNKPLSPQATPNRQLTIETLPDYSFLRLADLKASDSGAYTCAVANQFNQEDRTTTQVIVNVKLKWLPSAGSAHKQANNQTDGAQLAGPEQVELRTVKAGQPVAFECNAVGQPRPRIRWFRWAAVGGAAGVLKASQRQQHKLLNNDHHLYPNQFKLDDQQVKLALAQANADPSAAAAAASSSAMATTLFQRYELVNYKEGLAVVSSPPRQQQQQPDVVAVNSVQQQLNSQSASFANESATTNPQVQMAKWWHIETSQGANPNELYSRLLIERADPTSGGLIECEVLAGSFNDNGQQQLQANQLEHSMLVELNNNGFQQRTSAGSSSGAASGDKLRRLFGLLVNGKYTF